MLGEPAGCRWLLNWVDDTPREEMRGKLLGEVERSLGEKIRVAAGCEVHRCPPLGMETLPCCGQTVVGMSSLDCMTQDPAMVSCGLGKEEKQ